MKVRAELTAAHSDMKKLPLQPSTDLTRGLRLLPLSSSPQSVGDDDVTAETRDNRNSFQESTDIFLKCRLLRKWR